MPGELDNPRNRADLARRLAGQAKDSKVADQLEELAAMFLAEAAEREANESSQASSAHSLDLKLKPA